ncbi:DUF421 domain-containing protein [Paraliobacillus salinarum]|uniref:DUF421 domain-containing protein n=1 Tax=Paraliobacillus salinarum TaxID=1158996 RepID=UPI0015F7056C|nr:DUF421 domain-containing protein [Paraliobacillus salinarum]
MIVLLTEILTVIARIFTILPLLLVVTIFMGRRAIGELPVFDFLIVLTLGSVVGADIADPNIKHIHTAVAIIFIAILEKMIASLRLNQKIGHYFTFSPVIVIKDGKLVSQNLKKIKYSMDSILLMLRQNNIFDLAEVELAIIEANGRLSVFQKHTSNQIGNNAATSDIESKFTYPVIVDGKIYPNVLKQLYVDEVWLLHALQSNGVQDIEDVFFATLTEDLTLHFSKKHENMHLPPLYF